MIEIEINLEVNAKAVVFAPSHRAGITERG
jgi:hypothetical protein